MSKRTWSGRYAPLVMAGVRCAYRTLRGNPRGAFLTRRSAKRRRLVRRRPPVRTRTRVRLHQPVKQAGNGGSFSYFYYGRRKKPFMRGYAINPTQYYNSNLAGAITIGTGIQNISTVNCLFGCVANGIATDIDTIFGIIAPTTPKTSQVLFQSCSCELMLSNATNSNVKVQIYDIIARRDISGGTSNYLPDLAMQQSLADEGGTITKEQVGVLPFSCRVFTQFFKICKVTHLVMAEGQTHVHRIKFTPNKILNKEIDIISSANVKGLTLYQMIISHGTPSDPNSNAVTTCPGKLDYVVKKQYGYKWNAQIVSNVYGNNNLPITAGQHTMDIGSGLDHVTASS